LSGIQNIQMSIPIWVFFIIFCPASILGHASLIEPPSRAAMNMYGFPENPADYQHNEGFCGGFAYQYSSQIGGKCGICGDAWDANPRQHEAPGGKFANGIIVRNYQPGNDIKVTVLVTANHKGYFTFRLCKNNNINQDSDQSCFEQEESLLRISPSGELRYMVTTAMGTGPIDVTLRLPTWQCNQCILQWTYTAGNNWGVCADGSGGVGCGPQETFRSCADISINGDTIVFPTLPPVTIPPTAPVPSPVTTPSPAPIPSPIPAPSPPINPLPISGQTCVAVGQWAGDSGMASWCFTNCFHTPSYCPADRCSCIDNAPIVAAKECLAIGAWAGNSDMNGWCENNCNAPSPFCPSNMCKCGDGSPSPSPSPVPAPSPVPSPTPIPSPSPTPAPGSSGNLVQSPFLQLVTILLSKLILIFISVISNVGQLG